MKKKLLLNIGFLSFVVCSIFGQASNIGTPFVLNYKKQNYQGGTQNWDIVQLDNGIIYFANNEGLLEFTGTTWRIYPIANKTIVRSLAVGKDGKIYAGGQDEFGFYQANQKGELKFHSLKKHIPLEHQNFEDVWNILIQGEEVFFRASNKIYHFKADQSVQIYQTGNTISFLANWGNRLFVQDLDIGLLELKNGQLEPVSTHPALLQNPIQSSVVWTADTLLLPTLKNGIFYLGTDNSFGAWNTSHDDFFKKNRIYTAVKFGWEQLALGTSTGGLLILNSQRKATHWLSKKNGLHNNNLLSIAADDAQNLWLGLDNGIDYVKISEPFTTIYPDGDLEGTAYSAKIVGKNIYLGTSSGLYVAPWQGYINPLAAPPFQLINGTQTQVWGLDLIDNQLLLGHHEGSFIVEDRNVQQISNINGAWTFLRFNHQPDYLINGTYSGISLFRKNEYNGWNFIKELDELKESCRIMVQDAAGYFWVAHPYRGVYKIQINPEKAIIESQKLYSIAEGNPQNVFSVNGEVVFAAEKGIIRYVPEVDSFMPYTAYNEILGADVHIHRLVEAPNGNIWFVTEKEVGVLKIKDVGLKKKFEKVIFPELKSQLVGGFEFIYPYDDNNVFFGAEKGFIHYNPSQPLVKHDLKVLLTDIVVLHKKENLIFGGHNFQTENSPNEIPTFPSQWNNLRFHFASPWFSNLEKIEYQYYLEGLEKEWLNWTNISQKGYTNLGAGTYTFKLKAKNPQGQESPIVSYSFTIAPPWYAGTIAYSIYGAIFIAILISIIWIPRRKFKEEIEQITEEQKRREEVHQQELAATEAALIQVKNETLQNQIEFKNKELVSATLHLVQKGELIGKISEKLNNIAENAKDVETTMELKKVIRLLNHDQSFDEGWEQFTSHFDQVHSDFLKRLREKYPNLTPKDYRLCAYLRMNLSTKELASLMNISVRGVEVSRYRLRKKMELDSSINLSEFMMSF